MCMLKRGQLNECHMDGFSFKDLYKKKKDYWKNGPSGDYSMSKYPFKKDLECPFFWPNCGQ